MVRYESSAGWSWTMQLWWPSPWFQTLSGHRCWRWILALWTWQLYCDACSLWRICQKGTNLLFFLDNCFTLGLFSELKGVILASGTQGKSLVCLFNEGRERAWGGEKEALTKGFLKMKAFLSFGKIVNMALHGHRWSWYNTKVKMQKPCLALQALKSLSNTNIWKASKS